MARYCMNRNAQSNGDHEVHKEGCQFAPASHNQQDLGEHATCRTAVALARQYNPKADGCKHCSPECHTR